MVLVLIALFVQMLVTGTAMLIRGYRPKNADELAVQLKPKDASIG
jgi:hypothetical protein